MARARRLVNGRDVHRARIAHVQAPMLPGPRPRVLAVTPRGSSGRADGRTAAVAGKPSPGECFVAATAGDAAAIAKRVRKAGDQRP